MSADNRIERARSALARHDTDAAAQIIEEVLSSRPDDARANYLKGVLALQQSDLQGALASLSVAHRRDPSNPAVANTYGVALFSAGSIQQAEGVLRRAVKHAPGHPDAVGNLGIVLQHLGNTDEALAHLSRAVTHPMSSERLFDAWYQEAHFKNQLAAAAEAIPQIFDRYPKNPYVISWRAQQAVNAGRDTEARRMWSGLQPDDRRSATALLDFVWYLLSLGEQDTADKLLSSILENFPRHAQAIFASVHGLSLARRNPDAGYDMLERIEEILSTGEVAFRDDVAYRFSAGAIADQLGYHDKSFHHYQAANQAIWSRRSIPKSAYIEDAENIRAIYTAERLERLRSITEREATDDDRLGEGLVFVFGMPRSGTTLVEQILVRGGLVCAGGERPDVDEILARIYGGERQLGVRMQALDRLKIHQVRSIAEAHHRYVAIQKAGAKLFVDKTPRNFQHIGALSILFPKATFIHIQRAAEDTCLSCYFNYFSWNSIVYSYDLETLGIYYRLYQSLIAHWHEVLPHRILDVSYENLVENPETEIKRMLTFTGLPYSSSYLQADRVKQPIFTASIAQARQPIYRSSVGRWRAYERHIGPLLKALRT